MTPTFIERLIIYFEYGIFSAANLIILTIRVSYFNQFMFAKISQEFITVVAMSSIIVCYKFLKYTSFAQQSFDNT